MTLGSTTTPGAMTRQDARDSVFSVLPKQHLGARLPRRPRSCRSTNALATVLSSPVNGAQVRSQQRCQDKELLQQLWPNKQSRKMPFDHHNYKSISVWYSQENRAAVPRKRKTTFSCQTTTTEISTWRRQASTILALPGTGTGQLGHSKFVLDTQLLAFGEAGKRICKVRPLSGKGRRPCHGSRLSA